MPERPERPERPDRRGRPMTLRRTITVALVTIAAFAVFASAALVGLTSMLRRAGAGRTAAVESVRFAEEAQRDLLLHDRIVTPVVRHQIEAGIRYRLTSARATQTSDVGRRALAEAERSVDAYLLAEEAPGSAELAPRHDAAFHALGGLVAENLREAEAARASAERIDRTADALGVATAASVILAITVVLWWLHARALRPLFGLSRAMRRFGGGSIEERAEEDGAGELAAMARCFNEMATSIARRRRDRQTFIAGVAHDLRNPLAVLRLSTDLVRAGGPEPSPERAARVLDAVRRQVARLERMVGDLLDAASVEAGSLRLRLDVHDVRAIARDVTDLFVAKGTHTIELDLPSEPVVLECDDMRIEQVLSNLVSNALKYSPAGGLVKVRARRAAGEVTLAVSDEGVGMNEEEAAAAFEPFRRSGSLRDEVPGSGLGLFVVRRLVEAHGGVIDLQTAPGCGATFEIRLPEGQPAVAS